MKPILGPLDLPHQKLILSEVARPGWPTDLALHGGRWGVELLGLVGRGELWRAHAHTPKGGEDSGQVTVYTLQSTTMSDYLSPFLPLTRSLNLVSYK